MQHNPSRTLACRLRPQLRLPSRQPARGATLLLAAVLGLSACSEGGSIGRFSQALRDKLSTDKPAEVDLAQVGSVRWDSLYIFDAGTQQAANCALLRLGFFECQLSLPRVVKTGEAVLVFMREGQVAHAERHALAHGDFGPLMAGGAATRPQPVLRTTARFEVQVSPGSPTGTASAAVPGWRLQYKDKGR